MIDAALIRRLRSLGPDPNALDLADALWLAASGLFVAPPKREPEPAPLTPTQPPAQPKDPAAVPPAPPAPTKSAGTPDATVSAADTPSAAAAGSSAPAALHLPGAGRLQGPSRQGGLSLRTPQARALPGERAFTRALRPFRRRVPARTIFVLDEERTVQRIAEDGLWVPVLQPARARWLEVALVIDLSSSMVLWRDALRELRLLLEHTGGFRDVRVWWLDTASPEHAILRARPHTPARPPGELIAADGRRVLLVATDGLAPAWESGAAPKLLAAWGAHQPVALLQMLPQSLWRRTALGRAAPGHVGAPAAGSPNAHLLWRPWRPRQASPFSRPAPAEPVGPKRRVPLPVLTAEPELVAAWADLLHTPGPPRMPAVLFPTSMLPTEAVVGNTTTHHAQADLAAWDRVARFQATASPTAVQLAGLLAAAPLRLPVMRLVQRTFLPEARQVHLAEFFLSGLIRRVSPDPQLDSDLVDYEFQEGVRELLLDASRVADTRQVLRAVSEYLQDRFGQVLDFEAILRVPGQAAEATVSSENAAFAHVAAEVLRRLGGRYADAAAQLSLAANAGAPLPAPATSPAAVPPEALQFERQRLLQVLGQRREGEQAAWAGVRVLWVDDHEENNAVPARHLVALGATIRNARSTEEALAFLASESFDAVISDLARVEGPLAGLDLLDRLRAQGNDIPFAIYAQAAVHYVQQATDKGAVVCSSHMSDILPALLAALRDRRQHSESDVELLPDRCAKRVRAFLKSFGIYARFRNEDNDADELLGHSSEFQRRLLCDEIWRKSETEGAAWRKMARLLAAAAGSDSLQVGQVLGDRLKRLADQEGNNPDSPPFAPVPTSGHVWEALHHRRTIYTPFDSESASELVIPISAQSESPVVGVLHFVSRLRHGFTARQIAWLESWKAVLAERLHVPATQTDAPAPQIPVLEELAKIPARLAALIAARLTFRALTLLRADDWTEQAHWLDLALTGAESVERWALRPDFGPWAESLQRDLNLLAQQARQMRPPDKSSPPRVHLVWSVLELMSFALRFGTQPVPERILDLFTSVPTAILHPTRPPEISAPDWKRLLDGIRAELTSAVELARNSSSLSRTTLWSWLESQSSLCLDGRRASQGGNLVRPGRRGTVLIAGLGTSTLPSELQQVSEMLGESLAMGGFGLIAGGWPGVDAAVTRAYLRRLAVWGAKPEEWLLQVLEPGRTPLIAAGERMETKSYEESMRASVERADAVVLLSGAGGTAHIGRLALQEGVALFPLAGTGGDAAALLQHMLTDPRQAPPPGLDWADWKKLESHPAEVLPMLNGWLRRVLESRSASQPAPAASSAKHKSAKTMKAAASPQRRRAKAKASHSPGKKALRAVRKKK